MRRNFTTPIPAMKKCRVPESDEGELIRRVGAGEQAAFEKIYLRYHERLFRFVYRVTRRLDTVEEVIQDTMLVVWESSERYDHSCKLSTWLFGIAYRKALKSLAKSARLDKERDLADYEEFLADAAPSPAQQAEHDNWLSAALGRLPPDQRAVIELTFHQGLHYREIGEILGCPENTVKTRMFHARKKLQRFAASVP